MMKIFISDIQGDFLGRSLSVASQYTDNLTNFSNQAAQLELEFLRKAAGDTVICYFHLQLTTNIYDR